MYFGSDSITASFRYNKKLLDLVSQSVPSVTDYIEDYLHKAYTIGGMIIFPKHPWSMNQARGCSKKICDRWDLTLECISRYFKGETSPLDAVMLRDKAFFDAFVDFKGYVDFFFLQDCVSEDYSSVKIWIGDASFKKSGLPETVEEYLQFLVKEHVFLDKRNRRIQEYCIKHDLLL
jgi:hypothetical protein